MANYSKSAFAKSLGISNKELENRAKAAGYSTTEQYYNATGGTGTTQQDLLDKQQATQSDFLKRYTSAISSQPAISDIASRLESEYGLGAARNLATGLTQQALTTEGTMARLPEQITGETRGFDVNAAQRARIEETRRGQISKQLAEEARAAERANVSVTTLGGQVGTQLGYELAGQEKQLQPFAMEASLIGDQFARETTAYTTQLQTQTSLLLQKLQNEGTLAAAEAQQLSNLALQEQEYENAKKLYSYQLAEKKKYNVSGTGAATDVNTLFPVTPGSTGVWT